MPGTYHRLGEEDSVAEQPRGSTGARPVGRALVAHAPAGWHRAEAVFAMTVSREFGRIVYSVGEQRVSMAAPESVLAVVREHRTVAARAASGPWWRMLLVHTASGEPKVDYDYGETPFPPGQLFEPDEYRADLAAYPRARVPVWLAAYIGHGDRQRRTPRQAAAQARADRAGRVWARLAENEFPPFPAMWARWATIAAAFVAAGSERGPRMAPWTGMFEGSTRGGSTLYVLPSGRAVLSGGVWNAPALDAVYNGGASMPNFYAGAPDWVTDDVLNPRAVAGLLSFCYWWEAGHWYRGQSPPADECATAVPGMWTPDTTAGIIAGLLPDNRGSGAENAIAELIAAAEAGVVTRRSVVEVFEDDGRFDIDGALHQFSLAGLLAPATEPIPAEEAISRVRDYITGHHLDTTGYPLSQLAAERFSVGWMVHVPVPDGQLAIGRAIFYVGDDGVLEHSSSSIAAPTYIGDFERRFAQRHGSVARVES